MECCMNDEEASIFLTVFTPTYNRAHTLHRVYESIVSQSFKTVDSRVCFEWIIVDDGSTDNTYTLVTQWQDESNFPIVYYYQINQGKPSATRKGIELAQGELFLIADSDDSFFDTTFECFYKIWEEFSEIDKKKCGGIGVLCQDQFGNRVGRDFPIENQLIPTMNAVFGWQLIGLGETWAVLKTENLKKYFTIPPEAQHLKFIPESFFWNRITIESKSFSFFVNKVLRIYYKDTDENLSQNIRKKYPEGFLFESKWFVKKYYFLFLKYPFVSVKHLIKYCYLSLLTK